MIKTTIFDAAGLSVSLELRKELTIEQVKAQVLCELSPQNAGIKYAQHYKLVSSKSGRSLNDSKRLEDEVVYSNDELLLLRRNPPVEPGCSSSSSPVERNLVRQITSGDNERFRAPTLAEIQLATECITPMDIDRPNAELPPKGEHRTEIRKIMATLVEYSEVMLRDHPDVKPIFEHLDEKLNTPFTEGEPTVDPALIKKMTDMGFDQHLAKRALIAKKSCPAAALELLLSGQHDILFAKLSMSKPTKIPKAYAMLQCFQEYRRKMYKTNQKAVENLKAMGFSEPDVLDALRVQSNSEPAACNWLLSNRRATPENLTMGLDPDGVIYKAIIANPVIQLGLCTPKVLMALLQILENPYCLNRWITDADTTALLSHLFRIYHSEKTSLSVQ
ncbi:hypothetical protein BIW11_01983 [Tropilaelaps mercedesae]|uniref:Ubiquitin-associated domain-containing protein 1-like n=1 Tax=Tropilaelaps mercedesae TaxID=418985 RepID=A0A1V9X5C5_9ACAR|nr:hypothetical protein BIW11_01983 [Tropilaelaps mercedesae]